MYALKSLGDSKKLKKAPKNLGDISVSQIKLEGTLSFPATGNKVEA